MQIQLKKKPISLLFAKKIKIRGGANENKPHNRNIF